jgi:hypothetical protein
MKMIQSLWSCNQKDLLKFCAGWYAPEYHLMAWALSCLQLKKYHDEVILYSDSVSAKMLIDKLRLPYTDVICNLDKLNKCHPQLWALPKINTYELQSSPFLHVDGDVFIWEPFHNKLLNSDLIAQNAEIATNHYEMIMQSLEVQLAYIPEEIVKERRGNNIIYAYNAGILGGSDIAFFRSYTQKAKKFISNNTANFSKISVGAFNIFFEQYLFYCMVKKNHKKVSVLIDRIIPDNEYTGFGDFNDVPHNKQFLHLIGIYKQNQTICGQMACRLRLEYPEYYYRIIELVKNNQAPLKKDYYHFINHPTEKGLLNRYLSLKTKRESSELVAAKKNLIHSKKETSEFRTQLVKSAIENVINMTASLPDNHMYSEHLNDIILFEENLVTIIKTKFSTYSNDYLYARDIYHTQYSEFIFGDKERIYHKKIVQNCLAEIIESKFDWSEISLYNHKEKISFQLELAPSHFYTAIIPECDLQGYSLFSIDELDMLLLQNLKKPITVYGLLNQAKSLFDPTDLEESAAEFEILIFGRIKIALQRKLIKAVDQR